MAMALRASSLAPPVYGNLLPFRFNRKAHSEPEQQHVEEDCDVRENDKRIAISKLPVFNLLDTSDVDRILERLEPLEIDKGQVIIEQGAQDGGDMYFVADGDFDCYEKDKPKKILKKYSAGDHFGELSMLLGTPRTLSIRAVTKSVVWRLSQDAFDQSIKKSEYPEEEGLRLLKEAYKDENYWGNLQKISFRGGTVEASWDRPHVHQGRLTPFKPTDSLETQKLDDAALQTLQNGQPYQTTLHGNKLVVQDIAAPPKVVMDHILDYDRYVGRVPQMLESELYDKKSNGDKKGDTYFARLKTGMRGFSMEFFVKAIHHPAHNSVTWTLDYSKRSEIDDACGHWKVLPLPGNKSRIYYTVNLALGPSISKWVGDFVNKKAATDATAWVKKHSEQYAAAM